MVSAVKVLFNLDDSIWKLLITIDNLNVNIRNPKGDSPVHIAVANNKLKSTTMLLKLNGDLNITKLFTMSQFVKMQIDRSNETIYKWTKIPTRKWTKKSRKNTTTKTLDFSDNNTIMK